MTSQNVFSRSLPVPVARILKIAGAIVTLVTLFDILISPMPYQLGDRQWQIEFVTSVVERGVRLLVGIALFLTGCGIVREPASDGRGGRVIWRDPRFWALALASLLGLVYTLAFPLHLYNVQAANQESLEQINKKVAEAETQLTDKVNQAVETQRQTISQLLAANDDQISQLVKTKQIPQQMADTIKQLKAKPELADLFLKQQETEIRNQGNELKAKIGVKQQTLLEAQKTSDLKLGLRTGLGSLLLAIGFIIIGWMGLRDLQL
jgi:hypothetical protein